MVTETEKGKKNMSRKKIPKAFIEIFRRKLLKTIFRLKLPIDALRVDLVKHFKGNASPGPRNELT